MKKSALPLLYTIGGVLMAGIVGYGILADGNQQRVPAETAQTETASKGQQETAALDTSSAEETALEKEPAAEAEPLANPEAQATEEAAAPEAEAVTPPVFTLLRVEKDGSAVIAGSGPGNSELTLLNGDEEISKTKSGVEGDFVFVLDKPLSPGLHELYLSAISESGERVQSTEAGIINIPERDSAEEVTVLVSAQGQATRILQKPEVEKIAAVEDSATSTSKVEENGSAKQTEAENLEVAAVKEGDAKNVTSEEEATQSEPTVTSEGENTVTIANLPEAKLEVKSTPEAKIVIENKPKDDGEAGNQVQKSETAAVVTEEPVAENEEVTPEAPSAPTIPVLIEAADIENNKIFIAGTGEPGSNVNIYLENKLLGSAKVAGNGAFLFEGNESIDAGRHNIRADMTKSGEVDVIARAEVTLLHEPEPEPVQGVAELTPEKTTDKATDEASGNEAETATSVASDENAVAEAAEKVALATPTNNDLSQNQETAKPETDTILTKQDEKNVETAAVPSEPEAENAEPAKPKAKKVIRTGTAVIIRRGDNLWRLAQRNYGDGIRYTTIFEANRSQIRDPDLIFPGQVFRVPEKNRQEVQSSETNG